jgi:hypothetical protein
MESFETPSGLAVVTEERDERGIEAELKRLDPNLFLTRELHRPSGRWSYAVYHYLGPAQSPLHVLYWTEDRTLKGDPLPLSSGIFFELEARKRHFGTNLAVEAHAENERRREQDAELADEEREVEVTRYFRRRLRLGSGQNSQRFFPMDEQHVRRPSERLSEEGP